MRERMNILGDFTSPTPNDARVDLRRKIAAYEQTGRAFLNKTSLSPAEGRDMEGLAQKLGAAQAKLAELDDFASELSSADRNEALRQSIRQGGDTSQLSTGGRGAIFGSFGEQLSSIVEASRPGGRTDGRLFDVEKLAASGMNEGVGSEGGFRIEPTFATELVRRIHDVAQVAARCRKFPLGPNSNGIKIPVVNETSRATGSRLGGIQVYRTAEAAAITASKPSFGQLEIRLEKLAGICYATDELLSDSATLGAFLMQGFSEELAFALDDEILNGNGVGRCLGILQSPSLVTVTKKLNQTASTVVAENVLSMASRLPMRSRKTAVWLVNPAAEWQLPLMTIGTQPVYLQAGTAAASQQYGTLLGMPVIPCEQCAGLGAVGDIVLADLQQYILVKRDPKADSSMHVRFLYDEQTFRVTWRVNGAPLWSTALTPFKGLDSLSPFVTVEAR